VVTAKDLETLGLAWMPTISYDTQAVLAGDKVRFQGQEVAFVIATDEYSARDALTLIDVEYEPLPAVVNARKALDPDAPLIRDDKPGQEDNLASPLWEAGDKEATDRVFAEADVVVKRDIIYPRRHPAPLETCGMIADFNPQTGQLDIYNGNQAPNVHRTVYAHVAGLAEHMIRIRCNDIGGGFGNKVPVYPGYVCAIAGSIVAGAPVKWIEDRSENLLSTGFARDYIMRSEICAMDGKITGLRADVIADHGAFDSTTQPTKFPAGFFYICCGSYDLEAAHVQVKAVYTNKAPGDVAYRCSFRITEAVYLVERMVGALALEMGVDQIDLRMRSFIKPEQFPYETTTGWTYDSGNCAETMRVAMEIAGYEDLLREQAEKRARGELMGIGVSLDLPQPPPAPAAAAGGRGRGRQDRGLQVAGSGARHAADPLAVLRRNRRRRGTVRMELSPPAAQHPARRRERQTAPGGGPVRPRLHRALAAASCARASRAAAGGAADRRDRPSRRRLRGVPARAARRGERHDSGDRHDPRDASADHVLTSNRTRDLHDAVKRRCLYQWIDYPAPEREVEIVRRRVKDSSQTLAVRVADAVARMRDSDVQKPPGIAEAIDWLAALSELGLEQLDAAAIHRTLGSVLKYREDQEVIRAAGLEQLVASPD
jgi:Molybdopterin cofactor-binding domain/Aldehyde oxidase and xanthine dehydrogenase, a/b hammerhead domain